MDVATPGSSIPASSIAHEITVGDLRTDVIRAKFWIGAAMLCGCIAFGSYGLFTDRVYEATTTLMPVAEDAVSGAAGSLSSLASQYGGLASLAGLSVAGGGKAAEYLAVLQSEFLTESFIKSANLLPVLYSDKWDAHLKKWSTTEPGKVPTLWKANLYFKKRIRSVSEEKATGLVTLRIRWKDPQQAASWANDLVKMTNEYTRNKAIVEAERNIAYLNGQAAQTNIVEVRHSIYSLLQQAINTEMLARGREEYALKVIDPAYPPEKPASFGAITLAVFGLLSGALLSLIAILLRRIYVSA